MSNYLLIDIEISNKSYSFLFDTGCTHSMINQSVVQEINSEKHKVIYNENNYIPDLIFSKKDYFFFKRYTGYKTEITFDLKKKQKHLFYIAKKIPDVLKELKVNGIIGWDFIKKYNWKIDLKTKKVSILESNNFQTEKNDLTIDIITKEGTPYISKLKINDKYICSLLFDTGDNGFLSVGENIFSEKEKETLVNTLYGKKKGKYVEVSSIKINYLKFKAKSIPIGTYTEFKRSKKAIGIQFLSVFSKVYIDNAHNKLLLYE